MKGNELT